MKKVSLIFTLAVVAMMALAACSGGASNNNNGNTQSTTLPTMAGSTSTPAGGASATTPSATTAATTAATPAATTAATTSATTAATSAAGTATPAATSASGGTTGGATGGSTGTTSQTAVFDRLSKFLGVTVQDTKGTKVGTLAGVVVMVNEQNATGQVPVTGGSSTGSSSSTSGTTSGGTGSSSTGSTGSGTTSGSSNSGSSLSAAGPLSGNQLVFLAVKPDASLKAQGTGDLLIPWTAISSSMASTSGSTGSSSSGTTSGSSTSGTSATATPDATMAAGGTGSSATATPDATMAAGGTGSSSTGGSSSSGSTTGSSSSTGGMTGAGMTGGPIVVTVDAATLAGAPQVDEATLATGDFSSFGGQVSSFWNSQSISIPATGNQSSSGANSNYTYQPVFLTAQNYNQVQVVDNSGGSLGMSSDFIIDRANGVLQYVVLSGESQTIKQSGKFVVVPMTTGYWQKMGASSTSGGSSAGSSTGSNAQSTATPEATKAAGSSGGSTAGGASSTGSASGMKYQLVLNVPASVWASAPTVTSLDTMDFSQSTWSNDINTYWNQYNLK